MTTTPGNNIPIAPPILKRIGVIGDVHGEDAALEAVLRFLEKNGPFDGVLCTGDLPGKQGAGDMTRCCELLEQYQVLTIRGNHDRWYFDNDQVREMMGYTNDPPHARLFLQSLPKTREFETPFGPLLLCHGIGTNDMDGLYPGGEEEPIRDVLKTRRVYGRYRVMIAGHTHQRMLRRVGTVLCINPGTLLWTEDPGFLIVDFPMGQLTVYSIKPFVNEITKSRTLTFPTLDSEGERSV